MRPIKFGGAQVKMTSQAIFSELGSGARFDYRRYGGQIRKLSSKSVSSPSGRGGGANALPSSLDFFGSSGSASGASRSWQRRRRVRLPDSRGSCSHFTSSTTLRR